MSDEISNPMSSVITEGDGAIDNDKQPFTVDANTNSSDTSTSNTMIDLTNVSPNVLVSSSTDDKVNIDDVEEISAVLSQTAQDDESSSGLLNHNRDSDVVIIEKRMNNCPYDSKQWEQYESADFCAYRVLPIDMSLHGRAFAISVFLKTFDCRFNCGDIVQSNDGTKVVFLGVRYEKKSITEAENCAALVLLYFFKLNSSEEGITQQLIIKRPNL